MSTQYDREYLENAFTVSRNKDSTAAVYVLRGGDEGHLQSFSPVIELTNTGFGDEVSMP